MKRLLALAALFVLARDASAAGLPRTIAVDSAQLASALPAFAREALEGYAEPDRERYLDTVIRLRLAAGDDALAVSAIRELRAVRGQRKDTNPGVVGAAYFAEEVCAGAGQGAAAGDLSKGLREAIARLDDRTAVEVAARALTFDLDAARQDLERARKALPETQVLSVAQVLPLLRATQRLEIATKLQPLAGPAVAEDDARRFVIEKDLLLKTRDGAQVAALVVRPRGAAGRLPAAFNFTIYARDNNLVEAKRSAANGYAGVCANTRGKGRSPNDPVPYEHDGADATDVIDWISKQPWSDGRVGMFGGSYEGFAQWAAAKYRHPALKTIMPSVPVAPGIDVPMEGNVFLSGLYRWLPYVTNTKGLDEADYADGRWNALDWALWNSGKPYRSLPSFDTKPAPAAIALWNRWLSHPSYDAYWQAMIPHGEEFAKIDLPVLTTTGYFDGCNISALHYYQEHVKRAKKADHTLLIGPWDHIGAQRRSVDTLSGYTIDPVARIDIEALRYEWLNHVLKGAPRPGILKDRINYQVMGANVWKHAPSLAAMKSRDLALYLGADGQVLSQEPQAASMALGVKADLADRELLKFTQPMQLVEKEIDPTNGFAFRTEPLTEPLEISGLLSADLRFVTNRKDVDLSLELYEQTSEGQYLFLTYVLARASHASDRTKRRLLTPGKPQKLTLRGGRLTSRLLSKGSRVVVLLSIPKQPRMQVNYGSGKDVSDESIEDGRTPLELTLLAGSRVLLPAGR
ncbi:MAG: CocE/NonD family hydrolase [Acidobacteria bacterium]|nr:CocE/NonD family hydrolase [Acidobacteriota bacterium]